MVMARLEDVWESRPRAGWAEFRAALRKQEDRMHIDSELHRVLTDARADIAVERRRDPGRTPPQETPG
jgi:hypothetical protein